MLTMYGYFNNPNVEGLKQIEENQVFDRKTGTIQGKDLAQVISAFANSNVEGGLIVIGMDDDRRITGFQQIGQGKLNDILKIPMTFIPSARVETKQIQCKNFNNSEDFLLLMFVHYSPDKVIKDTRDKAYKRVGDSTTEMNSAEIRQLEIDKQETDFELEVVNDATIDDLDEELLQKYIDNWIQQDQLSRRPTIEESLLNRRFALTKDGVFKLTNGAILLFAKEAQKWFPGAIIRFLKYEGVEVRTGEELNITKDRIVDGSIARQVDRLSLIVREHVREFSRLGEDGKFITTTEYPEFAWTEAIVNAIVHRSYSLRNGNIFIKFFDDRLEVESPGNFPGIVTPENIYEQHFPRNPRLMDGFRILKIVKSASEGVDRMRVLMRAANLPDPEFINDKSKFQVIVILRNNIEKRRVLDKTAVLKSRIKSSVLLNLSPQETEITMYMLQNKFRIKTSEAAELLELSRQRIIDIFKDLMGKNIIVRQGESGPGVYYEMNRKILIDAEESLQPKLQEPDKIQQTLL